MQCLLSESTTYVVSISNDIQFGGINGTIHHSIDVSVVSEVQLGPVNTYPDISEYASLFICFGLTSTGRRLFRYQEQIKCSPEFFF